MCDTKVDVPFSVSCEKSGGICNVRNSIFFSLVIIQIYVALSFCFIKENTYLQPADRRGSNSVYVIFLFEILSDLIVKLFYFK